MGARSLLDAPLLALIEQARQDRLRVPHLPSAVAAFASAGLPLAPLLDALAAAEARGFGADAARRSAHAEVLAARAACAAWLGRVRVLVAAVRDRLALVDDPSAASAVRAVRAALPRDVVGRRFDATARCLDDALPLVPAVLPGPLVEELRALRAAWDGLADRSRRARDARAGAVVEAVAAAAALREALRRLRLAWAVIDAVRSGVPALPDDVLREAASRRRRRPGTAASHLQASVTPPVGAVTDPDASVTPPGEVVTPLVESATHPDGGVPGAEAAVTSLEVRVTAMSGSVTRNGGA